MDILNESDLLLAVENETFIKNGSKESCEGIKYDFILSNKTLTAESKIPHDIEQNTDNTLIKPGEIAFVITKESLDLPGDICCQLSTKRKLSLDGIIILGGFIIDPNYKGKLIFGLYNISSKSYPLLPGKKLIAGVFYRIDKKSDILPEPINDFPDELIKSIVDTKPNNINSINNILDDLKTELQMIKNQLARDDDWKKDFQNGLTDLQQLVKKISEKLDTEIDERKDNDSKLKMQTSIIKGIGLVLSFIFGGGLVSLIVLYVARILRLS